jgi:hypothetical protein
MPIFLSRKAKDMVPFEFTRHYKGVRSQNPGFGRKAIKTDFI